MLYHYNTITMECIITIVSFKLEQLECLHSEIPPISPPPPPPPWLPILAIHIRSQVTTGQSQSYKFKKIANNSNFEILQETSHTTYLLKYRYEMDQTRTVGATEWTQDAGHMDEQTEGRTDGRSETNILHCARGIIINNRPLLQLPRIQIQWFNH